MPEAETGDPWLRDVLLAQLTRRGASFYRDLLGAGRRQPRGISAARSRPSGTCSTRFGTWSGRAS